MADWRLRTLLAHLGFFGAFSDAAGTVVLLFAFYDWEFLWLHRWIVWVVEAVLLRQWAICLLLYRPCNRTGNWFGGDRRVAAGIWGAYMPWNGCNDVGGPNF